MNRAYSLNEDTVVSRETTPEELAEARAAAGAILKEDGAAWAARSCWNCNPAHKYFLADLKDKYLFSCVMGCGRWYYQGVDITKDSDLAEQGATRP